ncbi:hypothetical protein M426DRAFT_261912 [Hypoxylon sp. CI-4A]|nr:hypothetical protein M426DRAFT_261912 [Hypoxylon sp. CI-4A]
MRCFTVQQSDLPHDFQFMPGLQCFRENGRFASLDKSMGNSNFKEVRLAISVKVNLKADQNAGGNSLESQRKQFKVAILHDIPTISRFRFEHYVRCDSILLSALLAFRKALSISVEAWEENFNECLDEIDRRVSVLTTASQNSAYICLKIFT